MIKTKVEELLRDEEWYSRTLTTLLEAYGDNYRALFNDVIVFAAQLEELADWINVFCFNGKVYLGLESRRLDYQDAQMDDNEQVYW